MKSYLFYGRVIPERTHVNLTGLDELEINQPESSLKFKLKVTILLSVISATVTSEEEISDLLSLRNFVTDAISFFVDVIGFENGCGYTVEIDSCTYNDSKKFIVFGVNIDDLKEENRWETTLDVFQAHQIATDTQKLQLQRSMAEFRRGIKVNHDTGFHAYRAIESIKLAFNDSWDDMNTALNLNKTYTVSFKENHADAQRHGGYTFMTSKDRIHMLTKAKTIISRFVSYIKNNSQNLNPINYPELS
jgi:hypothetical protein